MHYAVYILYSYSCLKFYTGQTQDFDNRVMEHNRGETSSIKVCVPWRFVWKKEVETPSEAVKSEKKIKSRGAARFLADSGTSRWKKYKIRLPCNVNIPAVKPIHTIGRPRR